MLNIRKAYKPNKQSRKTNGYNDLMKKWLEQAEK